MPCLNCLAPKLILLATLVSTSVASSHVHAEEHPALSQIACDGLEELCGVTDFGRAASQTVAGDDARHKRRARVEYTRTEDGSATPIDVAKACKAHAILSDARDRCDAMGRELSTRRAGQIISACGEATT